MLESDFNKAAAKARDMHPGTFLDAILEERPDLQEKVRTGTVKPAFPGLGYSAYTVIIGDEVFKTAQYYSSTRGVDSADQILGIARERDLLRYLEGKSLPTPAVTHEGRDFLFFGMQRLPGEVLTRQAVEGLSAEDKKHLAEGIAAFCAALADAVPAADARAMGFETFPAEKPFDAEELLAQIKKPHIFSAFGSDADTVKEAVLRHAAHRRRQPTTNRPLLMHCDLKEGNILWDKNAKELTGFIDFGLSHLTGVESGFKKLYEKFPADFADMALEAFCKAQAVQVTRRDVQDWAAAEYASAAIGEIEKGQSPQSYKGYVKPALHLAPAARAKAPAPAASSPIF